MPLEALEIPPAVRGLRIALLVTGGIAAYKVVDLASSLIQAGCSVRVAMTRAATRFVGAPTFHGVTGEQPLVELWSAQGDPEPHVQLADWAQVVLVAPATANVVAKAAGGHADDVVSTVLVAARGPVVLAPAMNDAMWAKPSVEANLQALRERGITVVEPETGRLASGHAGSGRLARGQSIVDAIAAAIAAHYDLAGVRVVVSAGGTREKIDPVRFISNYSSGKMGYAIAVAAAERGARVVLVTAAAHPAHPGIKVCPVDTAAEMLDALKREQRSADLLVMAAAVADFRPTAAAGEKIHREGSDGLVLRLEKVPDILAELAGEPGAERVFRVGFAAEGADLERRAVEKLARKRLDAIVANDIRRSDIGFGSDDNEAVVHFRDGARIELPRQPKRAMADRILDLVRERMP